MKKLKLNKVDEKKLGLRLQKFLRRTLILITVLSLVFLTLIQISDIISILRMNDIVDGVGYVLISDASSLTVLIVVIILESQLLKLWRQLPIYCLEELEFYESSEWLDNLYKDIDASLDECLDEFKQHVLESLKDGVNQTFK